MPRLDGNRARRKRAEHRRRQSKSVRRARNKYFAIKHSDKEK